MRKIIVALITCVAALAGIGLIFVASASSVRAAQTYGDSHFFLKRQLVWMAFAVLLGFLATRFDYHRWVKQRWLQWALLMVVIVGLLAVFVPGIGIRSHGSNRWVGAGSARFQPSELAKLATVILMAAWMSSIGWRVRTFVRGFLIPIGVLGGVLALLLKEPDFGATLVTAVAGIGLMFVAGARIFYVVGAGFLGCLGFLVMILRDPVRGERMMIYVVKAFGKTSFVTEQLAGFLGKSVDQVLLDVATSDKKHQVEQSCLAFINGGEWGVGLNNSMQKHYYLPEAHTDFIYAIAGEEWGLVVTLGILLAFGGILVCGMLIATRAPDRLGRLIAFGLTLLLVFQAFFNIGVVTDCLPTKGLALPFISYGGSNLITAFAAVGILINIGMHIQEPDEHVRAQLYDSDLEES
ncbi:MAG: FtsW/RodA/SpoVE family cell cycle protein [Kiritimatiellia bacterium]